MSINPDHLSIIDSDAPRELFMSFGMLHELISIIGDITTVSQIAVDPVLTEAVLNTVLSARNDRGVIIEPLNLFALKISRDHIQVIINWVAGHVLDFFLTAIEQTLKTHETQIARLNGLTASGDGSPG